MLSRIVPRNKPTQQSVAEFNVRPLRFAYIVNRDIDYSELQQMIQYNTSLWGGKYNLFVPTDGNEIRSDWLRQLIYHDPDIIFFAGRVLNSIAKKLVRLLQPIQIFPWNKDTLETLIGNQPSIANPMYMDIILESIFSEKGKLTPAKSRIRYFKIDGIYKSFLESVCGLWLPDSDYQRFAADNLGVEEFELTPNNLQEYLETIDTLSNWISPLQLTEKHLKTSFQNFIGGGYKLVISTGEFDDLFIYHALQWSSAMRQTTVILPFDTLNDNEDYRILAEWFGAKVGGNTFDIISYSIEMEILSEIREKLMRSLPTRTSGMGFTGWVINIQRCNIEIMPPTVKHIEKRQIVNISDRRYSFEILRPQFLDKKQNNKYDHKRWICEVDLSPGYGNKNGFVPSIFEDLNYILSGNTIREMFDSWGSYIRMSMDKIAIVATMKNDLGLINLPTDKKVIETICKGFGYEVRDGNSGYYDGMINLLGGLKNASFLQNQRIRFLFSNRDVIKQKALTIIDMYKNLKIPKNEKEEFVNWIQTLSSKEILLRGYNLKCPTCGLNTWYELDRVHEHIICDGCRMEFQIPVKIDFAYRLNRLFLDRSNQGTVTILLTLLVLYETALDGLIWQADVNLLKVEHTEAIEIDIIAMCDGYLVVAECKNRFLPYKKPNEDEETRQSRESKTEQEIKDLKLQLERDINFALDIKAHLFLFATLEENIPTEIIEFIKEQDAIYDRLCVRLLSSSELMEGKFQRPDGENRQTTMYNIAGSSILPPFFESDDCSQPDPNRFNAISVF